MHDMRTSYANEPQPPWNLEHNISIQLNSGMHKLEIYGYEACCHGTGKMLFSRGGSTKLALTPKNLRQAVFSPDFVGCFRATQEEPGAKRTNIDSLDIASGNNNMSSMALSSIQLRCDAAFNSTANLWTCSQSKLCEFVASAGSNELEFKVSQTALQLPKDVTSSYFRGLVLIAVHPIKLHPVALQTKSFLQGNDYIIKHVQKWPRCFNLAHVPMSTFSDFAASCSGDIRCDGFMFTHIPGIAVGALPPAGSVGSGCLIQCGSDDDDGAFDGVTTHDYYQRDQESIELDRWLTQLPETAPNHVVLIGVVGQTQYSLSGHSVKLMNDILGMNIPRVHKGDLTQNYAGIGKVGGMLLSEETQIFGRRASAFSPCRVYLRERLQQPGPTQTVTMTPSEGVFRGSMDEVQAACDEDVTCLGFWQPVEWIWPQLWKVGCAQSIGLCKTPLPLHQQDNRFVIQSGPIRVVSGLELAQVDLPITFKIVLDITPHAPIESFASIVLFSMYKKEGAWMTDNNDDTPYKAWRLPGIWFHPGSTKLHVRFDVDHHSNVGCLPEEEQSLVLPMHQTTTVTVLAARDGFTVLVFLLLLYLHYCCM